MFLTSYLELKHVNKYRHRIVNIHPNKLLGIVGEHEDWPVERIRVSVLYLSYELELIFLLCFRLPVIVDSLERALMII
jgi:hypothetical protein